MMVFHTDDDSKVLWRVPWPNSAWEIQQDVCILCVWVDCHPERVLTASGSLAREYRETGRQSSVESSALSSFIN